MYKEQIAHLIRQLIKQLAVFIRYWPVFNWHPPYKQRLADVILDLQRMGLVPDSVVLYDSKSAVIAWSAWGAWGRFNNILPDLAVNRFRKSLIYHEGDYELEVCVLELMHVGHTLLDVSLSLSRYYDKHPYVLYGYSYEVPAGDLIDVRIRKSIVDDVLSDILNTNDLSNAIKKIEKSIILMDEWVRVARDAMAEWMRAHPDEYEAMLWLCRQFPVRDRVWHAEIRDALDVLIQDVANQLGVRSVHLDRKRSAEFGDGLFRTEWPTLADHLRVDYYTTADHRFPFEALVPSEIRRVVEWVYNDVIPTLVEVARGRRAGT